MEYGELLKLPPFGIAKKEKEKLLFPYLNQLTQMHRKQCLEYAKILSACGYENNSLEVPMLPAGLFKKMNLKSIPEKFIFKTVESSATNGQFPSRIFLDQNTARNQQLTLSRILEDFIGKKRLPMLIFDSPEVLKDRNLFSARGAGILGFSVYGRDLCYALDQDLRLEEEKIREFIVRHKGETVLVFGFTWLIWSAFCKPCLEQKKNFPLEDAILIHGGGFKKLAEEGITNEQLKEVLYQIAKIKRVHNYYGMAEQTGSIYMECECGHLHVSSYSELLIRSKTDLSVCKIGEQGLIQVLSPAAESYPGHSILTEDEGIILGEDNCPCGRKGKYFKVLGRIPAAEVRGCSDTMAPICELKKTGKKKQISEPESYSILPAFSEEVLTFLNEVSCTIRKERELFPEEDIRAFGFWCRRANLDAMKEKYSSAFRLGRGLAFHIAPSNVPVLFAYSLAIGLLSGCSNIVKLSSRSTASSQKLKWLLEKKLKKAEYHTLSNQIVLDLYDSRENEKTAEYSLKCDRRILWGGDETIRNIRIFPLQPWAEDVVFFHRNSAMLLSVEAVKKMTNQELQNLAERFYRDTYMMDQNACSSPSFLFWYFEKEVDWKIVDRFWEAVVEEAKRYPMDVWRRIRKYEDFCCLAARTSEPIYLCGNCFDAVTRVLVTSEFSFLWNQGMAGRFGTFFEMQISDLKEIMPFFKRRMQTFVCVGKEKEEIRKWLFEQRITGVDRVVAPGEASNLSLRWDGKDLIEALTRTID